MNQEQPYKTIAEAYRALARVARLCPSLELPESELQNPHLQAAVFLIKYTLLPNVQAVILNQGRDPERRYVWIDEAAAYPQDLEPGFIKAVIATLNLNGFTTFFFKREVEQKLCNAISITW